MDENPNTEPGTHIEAQKKLASGEGRPGKLFSLRQKLGQKAKQDVFRAYKAVLKAGRFLSGQFQRPHGARSKCAQDGNWIKSRHNGALEFA